MKAPHSTATAPVLSFSSLYKLLLLVALLSACALPVPEVSNKALSKTLQAHGYPVAEALTAAQYIDLNGDGKLDVIILLEHINYCGSGGCTALILENIGAQFRLVNDIPVARYISVAERLDRQRPWRSVWIGRSGGGLPAAIEKFVYDGMKYHPHKRREIKRIAYEFARAAEIYVQDGHKLTLTDSSPIKGCTGCYRYVFSFDHYGDPHVDYTLAVEVRQGRASFALEE